MAEIYVAKKINKNETVASLIKKHKGFQAECFDLLKDDVLIAQNIKLRDVKIDGNSKLRFKERQVKFTVCLSDGSSIPVEFGLSKKIKSLRDYLHDVKKVPIDQQRMTFDAQILDDEQTLNDYKIGNDSVLNMNAVNKTSIMPIDMNNNNIDVKMRDTTTISDLIKLWKGLNADNYDLVLNGKIIPRNMTLRDANVSTNSKLELQDRKISFSVRLCSGSRIRVSLPPLETILNLKDHLYAVQKVPVHEQRLSFNGRDLSDGMTIRECGIKEDSDVYLLGRLYGG